MAITASQAQGLVLALFGASAGAHLTGLTSAASVSAEAADLVTAAGLVLDRDLSSNTTFRDLVLVTNLKLTGAALTAAQAWMDGEFTKGTARGDIIAAAVTFLDGLTDTTNTFYATAAAYRATVAAAVTWSQGAGATVTSVSDLMAQQGTVSNVPGKSFTLTTATDTIVGTAGNDTITGAGTTYAAADQVVDGSSTDNDTYNLSLTASNLDNDNTYATDADSTKEVAPIVSGVENVNVTVAATVAAQVYASKMAGVANLTVARSDVTVGTSTITGDKTVSVAGVDASKVAKVTIGAGTTDATVVQATKAGATVNADAATGNVNVTGAATVSAAGTGTGDTVTVSVLSDTTEDAKAVSVTAGAETVNVGSFTGAITVNAATAKNVYLSGATGGATVVALGEKTDGTLGTNDGVVIAGIDDSGATVTTSYVGVNDTATTDGRGVIQLTGSSGTNDTATVNAAGYVNLVLTNLANVTLSGNGQAVVYEVGTSATKTTVTGSQDVTIADSASNLSAKTVTNNLTAGSLVVSLDDTVGGAAADLSKVAASKFVVAADLVTSTTNKVTLATGATVELAKDQVTSLDLGGKTAKATLNVVTADDTNADGSTIDLSVGAFTADSNVTTVNLTANTGKFTATGTTLDAAATLNISGSKAVTLGTVAAKAVSAAAATGAVTLTSATTKTVTTGAGNDVLTLSGTVVYTVDAGDGDNQITTTGAAAEGSAIVTGAGADVITLHSTNTAAMVISTGAGSDEIVINSAVDSQLVFGDGTGDKLTVGAAADVHSNTNFAISGVETVALGANTLTLNSAQFAGDNSFAVTGTGGLVVVGKSATAANAIDASGVTRASGVTATVTLEGNAKADTITATAGNDTINATAGADVIDGGTGTDTFTYAGLTMNSSLEGTGNGTQQGVVVNLGSTAVTATDVLGKVSLYTADANTSVASNTAVWTYSGSGATNSAATQTLSSIENVTGSGGADYIVGSAGANVLSGGAGADYIVGGLGADTITGGAGADTIVLTETSAAADTVVYADSTEGSDTITGFAVANDVLKFIDFTSLALAGTANKTFQKAVAASFTAAAGNNIIVITDAVANNTAAGIQIAIADINTAHAGAVADGVIVIAAAASGDAKVWFDAEATSGNSVELATLTGVALADLANLATGNFVIA